MNIKHKGVFYFGFNSFSDHKRGVENVIDFQSKASIFEHIYYFHWGSTTSAYKYLGFTCISINNTWYWPLILNLILFRLNKKNKFIIHSHNPLFSFFSAFKTDIFTVHDGLYYLNKLKKSRYKYLFLIIELLLYFRCTFVHFISKFAKENSLFGNRKNFIIIPNTTNFETLVVERKLYQNKPDEGFVLIVRSIEERARVDLILDVAERLGASDLRFVIVGKGPLLVRYQQEIADRKLLNVEMTGYVDDKKLLDLYSRCELVMMIAEYGEGFGLPIIEGYLFNKPVIASNCCAIPEVIISADYLFENDVDSIIHSLNYVSNIKNVDYFKHYSLNFSNVVVFAQFQDLYKNFF